ncbi:PTS mannose/fructose/sorbose/N-acetylgalactosamine transporter subunit IIC [Lacticaseibacillus zeae]|uniref:PTS sugar transporter subunit IIC n=1 Tax=Lacticaseibacillus zeae subsp. silagei TaxID=3068307 RepID=A0ABD7ZB06_LACZE|nr:MULTISPECIES: PTS sugar transporter subunit IIC [Lacticaseibacillus]MDE3314410.1 PTS sugar transporter subunit IIC [Lacticaseibacillus zeae]OFR98946.1 PTS lactose transporter subunit IIBC [Lactobacillus sp. HMSC068F07]WLV84041.1 PTS sugar transporter subunit IIC [Lacticaseibacillus sp. NCIMB 15475]WLV86797.1 PTS sugar transporter subunit IIC [Lacticaseibacillus sp. NCIMB 15474]
MLLKTFLIGLVAFLGYGEYFLTGRGQVARPIVIGPLTGFVLGDLTTGIEIGAALELAYIGVVEIGASVPQDMVSSGVLGTVFAISTGKGISAALTFGLPLSMLVLLVQNLAYVFVAPLYVAKCDQYAREGNSHKLSMMSFWGGTVVNFVPSTLLIMAAYYFGTGFSSTIVHAIPQFVQDGLVVASGLLPAFGFAMLIQQILRKEIVPYLVLGFALSAYLKMPIIGVAIIGMVIVMIMYYNEKKNRPAMIGGSNNDDTDSF